MLLALVVARSVLDAVLLALVVAQFQLCFALPRLLPHPLVQPSLPFAARAVGEHVHVS